MATSEAELLDSLVIAILSIVLPAIGFFGYFVRRVGLAALGSYILGFFTGVSAPFVYVLAAYGQSTAQNATGLLGFVESHGFSKLLTVFFFSVIFLLCFLAFLGTFVKRVYPKIPERFGGAEPKEARLLIASDAVAAVKSLGILVPDISESTPGQLSSPVMIV